MPKLSEINSEIGVGGMFGGDLQSYLLATACYPEWYVGLLDGFRLGDGSLEVVVLALVGDLVLGPERLHDLDALLKHPEARCRRKKLVAVTVVLVLVPAGTYPHLQPTVGDHVN